MAGGLLQTVGDFDFVQENKCGIEYTVLVDEFTAVVDAQFHQVVQLADISGEVAAWRASVCTGWGGKPAPPMWLMTREAYATWRGYPPCVPAANWASRWSR